MSSGIDNNIDWTAPATPGGERVAPSLSRPKQPPAPAAKPSVMDTLLGRNDLVALDESGRDPYNATGRHFRR
jgi:hypothetical protein